MRSVCRCCAAAVALGLAAASTAQSGVRGFAAGVARRADHAAWPRATVVCVSAPDDLPADCADVVTATADADGRFRAALLPARAYSVFAHGDVVDGRYDVCKPQGDVVVGTALELVAEAAPRVAVQVECTGSEAWRARGPLRLKVDLGLPDAHVVDAGEAGPAPRTLPPAWSAFVRVCDRDGQDLASGWVPVDAAARARQLQPGAPDPNDRVSRARAVITTLSVAATRIELPPPLPLALAFVDEAGRPLPGVTIAGRSRSEHCALATSGGDGVARLLIPDAFDPGPQPVSTPCSFWIEAAGHVAGPCWSFQAPVPDARGLAGTFRMPAANRILGRLWLGPGRPAANVHLLLWSPKPSAGWSGFARSGYNTDGTPLAYRTGADGRFAIDGRWLPFAWRLGAFLREGELAALTEGRVPLHPRVLLAAGVDQAGSDTDLGDLVLSQMVRMDLRVATADGTPAARQAIAFREVHEVPGAPEDDRPPPAVTDALGQLRILARPGVTLSFAKANGREFARVVVPARAEQAVAVPLTLPR